MEFQLNCFKSERWCYRSAILNMPANLENAAVAVRLEKVSFHSNSKEGQCQRMFKHQIIVLISHASKVMLKVLQARPQQHMNWEFPDVQAGFRKGRGTWDQTANICWIMEKPRKFQKNIYFCFTDYAKAFDCVDHNKLWKVLKEMGAPDHLSCLLRNQEDQEDLQQIKCRSRRNKYNQTWNYGLVQIWERSVCRLFIVTLFI